VAELSSRSAVLDNSLRYIEAVLIWSDKEYLRARELFTSLGRDTEYEDRHRPRRRLFIADHSGMPITQRGRLLRERSAGHWVVDVEGSSEVALLARDFPQEALSTGREVRNFAVAFNYLGPIADPINRYEGLS
jgi:hypothetical protein